MWYDELILLNKKHLISKFWKPCLIRSSEGNQGNRLGRGGKRICRRGMGRVSEKTCFHTFRRHYGTIWLSPTCLLLLKDAPCFIQNSHTWILGCLAFGQFGVSMTLVYSGRGWVKCGLVLYIIYKFSLSVNTEDYVLWRLTFCLVSGVREGCIWKFRWSEELLWATRLHWLRQVF